MFREKSSRCASFKNVAKGLSMPVQDKMKGVHIIWVSVWELCLYRSLDLSHRPYIKVRKYDMINKIERGPKKRQCTNCH